MKPTRQWLKTGIALGLASLALVTSEAMAETIENIPAPPDGIFVIQAILGFPMPPVTQFDESFAEGIIAWETPTQ